jgi:hypothetical protein
MDTPMPMFMRRVLVLLRARDLVDRIALASMPLAAFLIGATVVLS